jgi:hypothetical protein
MWIFAILIEKEILLNRGEILHFVQDDMLWGWCAELPALIINTGARDKT